ncbi:MAG: T9SS type A sorting domain-containing protein [Bacteroidetes bacterium]|nr:T9SS type A sorting domain-containing protein [Bacteroidota bacterium]
MKTLKRQTKLFFRTLISLTLFFLCLQMVSVTQLQAQIWEPEGLNMPGAWNSWNNPPANNLALASNTQVVGGRVVKFSTGVQRWQTIFSVADTGGDVAGGTYEWLFTSGSLSNPWGNKWSNVNVIMNTLQHYTYQANPNNTITVANGKWYAMNFQDSGYVSTRAIFMETSAQPVNIASVSVPSGVNPGNPVVITVALSQAPCAEELFYLRYSTDAWATSNALSVSITGSSGSALIPGQPGGTTVAYYAFSSTLDSITADYDLLTIKLNSNGGTNYSYTVINPTPVITFANLHSPPVGMIEQGQTFEVIGRAEIPGITGQTIPAPGLEAWVGWSATNTNPSAWTNWIAAPYLSPFGVYDQFSANLGASMITEGTFYYATRFRLSGGNYLYGGYSITGGGFWDSIANISGVLTVTPSAVPFMRTLENITVNSEIIVCYDAKKTISVAGNNTFFRALTGSSVTLIAGQNIILLPGTWIESGAYLLGHITTTAQYCSSISSPAFKSGEIAGADPIQPTGFSFKLFPNPASSQVTIDIQDVAAGVKSRMELFGIRGNRISDQTITGSGSYSLSLTDIPSGVYFIRIISGDKVQTKMLVKQ